MKVRQVCKCGGEFEAHGLRGNIGPAWRAWVAVHNLCYGISHWRDDGAAAKLIVAEAEQLAKARGDE